MSTDSAKDRYAAAELAECERQAGKRPSPIHAPDDYRGWVFSTSTIRAAFAAGAKFQSGECAAISTEEAKGLAESAGPSRTRAEVMLAHSRGATIEIREAEWEVAQDPGWDWMRYEYRVSVAGPKELE